MGTQSPTLTFSSLPSSSPELFPIMYTARDGAKLPLRRYPGKSDSVPLVVILHGSGWHGGAYITLGQYLFDQLGYEVLIPDLRGHGVKPERRGDVDYIGQLEDDLADLITTFRKPQQPVYMVGHSSGGGLVIRFAGGTHGGLLEKAVLVAPFLKHDAPTTRPNCGGWAKVRLPSMIALSILNGFGIRALNGLNIIDFNFPDTILDTAEGKAATRSYSFRLNQSYAPREDYTADIAKLPKFLLLAGKNDEAFVAQAYEPTMSAVNSHGEYRLIDNVDHLGIISNADALATVAAFLAT